VDEEGRWVKLANLREYLLAKPSLHDRLESLRSQLKEDEVRRSIWLVHCPPADLGLDRPRSRCGSGMKLESTRTASF